MYRFYRIIFVKCIARDQSEGEHEQVERGPDAEAACRASEASERHALGASGFVW